VQPDTTCSCCRGGIKSEEEGLAGPKQGRVDASDKMEDGRQARLSSEKGCAKSVRARRSAVTQKFPTQISVVPTLTSCTHAVKLEPGYNSLDSAVANVSRSVRFQSSVVFMTSTLIGSIPAHGSARDHVYRSAQCAQRANVVCKWQAYQVTRHEEHPIRSQDAKSIQ
jgi:hypothetical protein